MVRGTIVAAAVVWAACARAETLFVQAARLELRSGPSPADPVVAEVAIGAPCRVVRKLARGWARLDCLTGAGHAELTALGRDLPSYKAQWAIAHDSKRPYVERVVAAENALALGDASERDADGELFREVVLGAAFEALARHRQARSPPAGSVAVPACAGPEACVAAALPRLREPAGAGVEAEVIVKGPDFVALWLSPEGLLQVGAGHAQGEAGGATRVTVEWFSTHAFIEPALRALLPGGSFAETCLDEPPSEDELPICVIPYAQNCSPSKCAYDRDHCEAAATAGCYACASRCARTCRDCRARCAAGSAACLKSCLAASGAGRAACGRALPTAVEQCNKREEQCVTRSERLIEGACRKACDALWGCISECMEGFEFDDEARENQCRAACIRRRRTPRRCQFCADMQPQ